MLSVASTIFCYVLKQTNRNCAASGSAHTASSTTTKYLYMKYLVMSQVHHQQKDFRTTPNYQSPVDSRNKSESLGMLCNL